MGVHGGDGGDGASLESPNIQRSIEETLEEVTEKNSLR